MKPMDKQMIVMHLVSLGLDEAQFMNSKEIDEILGHSYEQKLKSTATKDFLKWARKTLELKLKPRVKELETDLQNVTDELENL